MPYDYEKTGKNKVTVTKADSGKVVGHTTPSKLQAYLAALHANEPKMAEGGYPPKEAKAGAPSCGMSEGGSVDLSNLTPELIRMALKKVLE